MATSTVLEKYLPEAKESLLWVPGIELIFRIAENKAQNKHTSEDGNSPMTARRYFVFSQAKMTTCSKNKQITRCVGSVQIASFLDCVLNCVRVSILQDILLVRFGYNKWNEKLF